MAKLCLLGLMFLSMSAFASDWQMTYYNTGKGSLLIDKSSIVETQASMKKFWTLYAPRVSLQQPGEGYAYNKMLHQINCVARTAAILEAIYYDANQVSHDAAVEDKAMHNIVPDTEDDFLWQYICKADQQAKLTAPVANGISEFLKDQVKFTKENDRQFKNANGGR